MADQQAEATLEAQDQDTPETQAAQTDAAAATAQQQQNARVISGQTEQSGREASQDSGAAWLRNNSVQAIIAAPFVAMTASFGLVIGTAAAVLASPVLLPFAVGGVLFKGLDKIITPVVYRRREKAADKATYEQNLELRLTELAAKNDMIRRAAAAIPNPSEKEPRKPTGFKPLDKFLAAMDNRAQRKYDAKQAAAAEAQTVTADEVSAILDALSQKQAEPEIETAPEAEPEKPSKNEREVARNVIQYDPQDDDFERVGNQLSAFTRSKGAPDYDPKQFAFKAVDSRGETIGEVIGQTIWGQTQIELLHVKGQNRGRGVGQKLLKLAEEFAKEAHDSRGVQLWTPSFQGEGFYERAGYEAHARFPLNTDGYFDGQQQDHIIYYKSLEPNLVHAAWDGDYNVIADYAEKYPERVLAKLNELDKADPELAEGLSPYFTKAQALTFTVDEIREKLEGRTLAKQTATNLANKFREQSEKTAAKFDALLEETRKNINAIADGLEDAQKEIENKKAEPGPPNFHLNF